MPDLEFERIELNAIPDGTMPVFHASQFETMRPFIADLKWGNEDFAPGEDNWCTLSIRKTDDTLVIIDDIDIDNNKVSCILTQQSVACFGDNFCQLKVWGTEGDEDGCIACLNFILHVQPDPEAGGLTSESEINNLTEQIETITQEVIGEDYYNKTEVDGLISGVESQIPTKTSDLTNDSGYITTAALTPYAKTADLAAVATTGDYDDLLNKPTIPEAQVQTDWEEADNTKVDYIKNKPDIAAMIADALLAVMPVGTESGPIASFDTELDAPFVNVSCNVTATGGNGTPDNPNPIVGYTEANITRCGVNLFDVSNINDTHGNNTLSINGDEITITWVNGATVFDTKNKQIFKAGNYIIKGFGTNINKVRAYFYNASDNTQLTNIYINTGTVITLTADFYIAIGGRYDDLDTATFTLQLEVGSTAHDYSPYNGDTVTIAFGQTVYGGVLDVTRGKLTVMHYYKSLGDLNWSYNSGYGFYTSKDSSLWGDYNPKGTPNTEIANLKCDIYETDTYQAVTSDITNFHIAQGTTYMAISDNRYTDGATFKTAMSGHYIAYELATPFDIDLTPVQIRALVGENNVYSDTNGDTTVQYKDSIQHYIDTRV